MSSLSQPSSTAAPWKALFLNHLSKMDSPEFVFSSLQRSEDKDASTPYLPRARYCIFRSMWAELPGNKHNQAPMNERIYESDLPTFTTDVRMGKVPELFASSQGHGDASQSQGSGGGGPVEAVFWVKEVKTQWRFKGQAYVIAQDIEGVGEGSSGSRTVKSTVGERMKLVKEAGQESWSWTKELTAHFGNVSPGMRGTFRDPPPGTSRSVVPDDPSLDLGQKVDDFEDEAARRNFRVVVIVPDEVDRLDLTDPYRGKRWLYSYGSPPDGRGEALKVWTTDELWP